MWGALSDERRVCRLQLLLVLASAVILRSESRGTRAHILLSQIRDSPNLESQVPVFISPRKRVAQFTPRHWVPFSSPPTTRRSTMEVFEPSSTRTDGQSISKSWCRAPSGGHDQIVITFWQLRSWVVGRLLWLEDGSVFCICCWPWPA
jgi:hypothetical protein